MKSMLALIGATLLTLMLAAPAAATQRVQIVEDNPIDFEVEVDSPPTARTTGGGCPSSAASRSTTAATTPRT